MDERKNGDAFGDSALNNLSAAGDLPESRPDSLQKNISDSDLKWRDEFVDVAANEHHHCHMCNGYYGMNHCQPICTTCHLFLYQPTDLEEDEAETPQLHTDTAAKNDSEDSGTEEPPDLEDEGAAELAAALGGAASNLVTAADASAPEPRPVSGGLDNIRLIGVKKQSSSPALKSYTDLLRQRVKDLSEYRHLTSSRAVNSAAVASVSVHDLPLEVLLEVFSYLSDMGLYAASNVCYKWHVLIDGAFPNLTWEKHVKRRWPLFKPHFKVESWRDIHSQLVASAPCQYCTENMRLKKTASIREGSWRHRRLTSELRTLQQDPPEGILATPLDEKCSYWQAMITGPRGTPYEGGKFYLYLQIPQSYPMKPPVVQFITKIFHPNVSRHGDIGLDSIHHNWSLALTLSKILLSIQSLLTDPYLKVCMEPSIARCYQENIRLYNKTAREWTWKYATTEKQQVYLGLVNRTDNFVPFLAHAV